MDLLATSAGEPEAYKKQSLSNDIVVMDLIKENEEEYLALTTKEERVEYVERLILDNAVDYGIYYEIAAQRVVEKYVVLNQFNLMIVLIIIVIGGFLGYKIPNMSVSLNLILNRGAVISDEVIGFYTICVLLINHKASNVYVLFDWLKNFATVFKKRIQNCIDNLNGKEILALERGISNKHFSRLIECLYLSYNGADLKSAFAGIEQLHLFQEESRRILNEQIIRRRVGTSEILSWIAIGVTFTLYVLVPLIFAISEMLLQLSF
jgi:hypothetical protein